MIFVDLELKAIAEKHGHLCPDLAIGWRVGSLFREYLPAHPEGFLVYVYNSTCAVQALTLMGFETKIEDLREHTYTLISPGGDILSLLTVRPDFITPPVPMNELGQKIKEGRATYYEKAHYLHLLDHWVVEIISAAEDEIFWREYEERWVV